jgi:hypothetical protein
MPVASSRHRSQMRSVGSSKFGDRMRDANTFVSVGLPVRNGGARIDAAVKSVLAKTVRILELVICNNASTDDAEELVSRPRRTEQPLRLSTDDIPLGMYRCHILRTY